MEELLRDRFKAEVLCGEYFSFPGRIGPCADEQKTP
jgi:hypothetical protein